MALARPNGLSVDEVRAKVSDTTAKVEFLILDLNALFLLANDSRFTSGADWISSFQKATEQIQAEANKLASPNADLVAIGMGLNSISTQIETFDRRVRKRLEREVRVHLPR